MSRRPARPSTSRSTEARRAPHGDRIDEPARNSSPGPGTGGAGFIGVNLIAELEKHSGFEIVVLDNESLGKAETIAGSDVRFIAGDIVDPSKVREAMQGVHSVIHLAADTRIIDSIEDPNKNFEINVKGTFELLCAARDLGVTLFINASSGGAILGPQSPPIHEKRAPSHIAGRRQARSRRLLFSVSRLLRSQHNFAAVLEHLRSRLPA